MNMIWLLLILKVAITKTKEKTGRRSKFTRKKARTSKRNKKATFYYFFYE